MSRALPFVLFTLLLASPVQSANAPKGKFGPAFEQEPYGRLPDGSAITQYTLINRNNVKLKCIDYGAIITELDVPDKNGVMGDVVLGFDKLEDYLKGHPFFGTNAGRVANRIANAKFELDGKTYTLFANNLGKHTLHGGKEGFDKKVWRAEPFMGPQGPGVKFNYLSKDGEEGFPGALSTTITYTLTDNNEVVIDMRATTTKATPVNLAHHSYFNLAGHGSGTIHDHSLQMFGGKYTKSGTDLIPTGEIVTVNGTPFDFTQPKPLGKDLKAAGGDPVGFDLNYVLDTPASDRPRLGARVTEPKSGRTMEVWTTEPGLQLYTSNFMDGKLTGKGGSVYPQYAALCLEAQKFPDSINHPEWKEISNSVLRPGETYKQTTIYKFGTAK
jgi:aldose 1-epimerase